ncbi:4-hydroxy-2-oxo-heptane-1,7-dioate aldolase [Rhodobacteraceae bacterium HSP-20]|uniref:4-hydroxy-2-oxo-heptane-1,7-dioate aldolase n=1 Tax=Paragemmobacter amnigenus TaxID=2852097 RepID=A0ABS6IZF0_9RHOB|nr:aldolase/citrate lyase family protein [Rhodobacter amnigenus]MBU9696868.1 4-hydroxy-2-oxo-heptane-1,7-dioate aldolase [Rhodobacter amnigenus]MBV4388095.1 4-hydroxy-2-oxo-heptane-1,7-dioate aldolase [Rhodobacter amnigenus]
MMLPQNRFKKALRERRQQIGLWNSIPGPLVAELLATCGFDWVVIDTEHAVTDIPDTMAMMQAMAPYRTHAVVRPAANDPVLIKRVLDLGAQTLLLPYVQTAEEARAAVAAIRYAPRGIRGVAGMTRASVFGQVAGYHQRAEEELCLILQVETIEALGRVREIAAVDGVDALFIGPADLAASMGHVGNSGHPEVVAAIELGIRDIVAAGKPAGILTLDHDFAQRCIGWGTTFTAVGMDIALLANAARSLSAKFRAE